MLEGVQFRIASLGIKKFKGLEHFLFQALIMLELPHKQSLKKFLSKIKLIGKKYPMKNFLYN
jgi:hypothetical protein